LKTTLSTVDGANELRFAFTVSLAVKKTRSDGALVAGMANIVLASNDNLGYISFCDLHQANKIIRCNRQASIQLNFSITCACKMDKFERHVIKGISS